MNKSTRSSIQRATQAGRALLERAFSAQLEGTYDILLDGTISEQPGSHLSERQKVVREKLVAAVAHKRSTGLNANEAVDAYLREAAFTTLNRFVALKMLEARQLVQECVSEGDDSSGFKEFTALAPGLVVAEDRGYRLYIETIFDEIGQEVKVLFDRHDVVSLLWPDRQTLLELLGILNDPELASVWVEDETIGWVYQYFNGDEERSKMREESQAPRNSHELAVRNQFFTPRYVVQFLTDNTLGRTWYEMMQGETKLAHLDYLVRRPNEVFLAEGAPTPESEMNDSELSQEELLQQTVYVPFRAKKDPRDLRVLDPACGSGHFLLYAFELLVSIYEEAWSDAGAAAFTENRTQLRADYGSPDALRRAMPELILRHNLHGVDIDPRAAQIAALGLWMRAQRTYNQFDVNRAERPPITKTNIVVAEPMPGDAELVEEFAASLKPAVLGNLFKKMVEEMKLAGELGSLLKIEESISKAVKDAAEVNQQGNLFAGKVESQDFWDTADEKIIAALTIFAESAAGSAGIRRQLFAGDAAQGVAFIELMRKRFDAVLMNPPFGETSVRAQSYLSKTYLEHSFNLICSFSAAGKRLLGRGGHLGAIVDKTVCIKSSYESFRKKHFIGEVAELLNVDLGWDVLDGAQVETWCLVSLGDRPSHLAQSTVIRLDQHHVDVRPNVLRNICTSSEHDDGSTHGLPTAMFLGLPNASLGFYRLPRKLLSLFTDNDTFEPAIGSVRQGLGISDSWRYYRLIHEVPISPYWVALSNGGGFSPYFRDIDLRIWWKNNGYEIKAQEAAKYGSASRTVKNEINYFREGIGYPKRTDVLNAYVLPKGCIFTVEGLSVFLDAVQPVARSTALALLNSRLLGFLISTYCGQHKHVGYVKKLPAPNSSFNAEALITRFVEIKETVSMGVETNTRFLEPLPLITNRHQKLHLSSLHDLVAEYCDHCTKWQTELESIQNDIDRLVFEAYSVGEEAIQFIYSSSKSRQISIWQGVDDQPEEPGPSSVARILTSYAFGLGIGRFKPSSPVRQTGKIAIPEMPPWPISEIRYSDGTLGIFGTSPDISLVDDPGHEFDATARVTEKLELVLAGNGECVREISTALTSADSGIREWLQMSYFDWHLSRYKKGRRKAPIYWQLATPSASYSVWCYYHCLTCDTFFRVANDYVTPKVDHEERKLNALRQEVGPDPSSKERKAIDDQETFVAELRAFNTEVTRIAPLWNPNLNDGVIINFAPLWRLVPQHKPWQKECNQVWDKLVKGDYDWAHLAMHLWPERVAPKCQDDRSLAIAHGLEDEFWYEDDDGKWQKREISSDRIEELVSERASTAVKAALKDLLEAPAPTGQTRRKQKARA